MIKSGKLDRQINVMREAETVAESGAVSKAWATVATVRAELVQRSADEYLAGFGEAGASGAVFRIRYLAGITTADRVAFDGVTYDIDEVVELGRKRGLELRCSQVTA